MIGRIALVTEAVEYACGDLDVDEITHRHADALDDLAREIREALKDGAHGRIPHLQPVNRKTVRFTSPELRHSSLPDPIRSIVNAICPEVRS
jgi:hypothetical protein